MKHLRAIHSAHHITWTRLLFAGHNTSDIICMLHAPIEPLDGAIVTYTLLQGNGGRNATCKAASFDATYKCNESFEPSAAEFAIA